MVTHRRKAKHPSSDEHRWPLQRNHIGAQAAKKIIRAGEKVVVEYNKAGEEEAMECVTVGGVWGSIRYRTRQNSDGVTAVAEEEAGWLARKRSMQPTPAPSTNRGWKTKTCSHRPQGTLPTTQDDGESGSGMPMNAIGGRWGVTYRHLRHTNPKRVPSVGGGS